MSKINDLNRQKAQFAFEMIDSVKDKDFAGKFSGHIKNMPMYIYNNGLVATLAFVLAKSSPKDKSSLEKCSYKKIGLIFLEYFVEYSGLKLKKLDNKSKEDELDQAIKELINCSSKEYRRITLDILSMLEWLVRFSDGMLESGDDNGKK